MNKLLRKKKVMKQWLSVLLTIAILFTSLGLENFTTAVQATITFTTIYLKDDTSEHWIGNDNAVIELVDNTYGHTSYIMKKVNSTTWSAKVPATTYNVTFNRLSPSKTTQWNSWSAGGRGSNRNDISTWSSTYHATVPEHGYWDGTPEYIEGFHEGDVIYLDYYTFQNWEISDAQFYVNFTNATKVDNNGADITISSANSEKFNPVLLSDEIEEQVYTHTVTAEEEGATELRFWRGNSSTLWNYSVVLTYTDYQAGNNCVKVEGWNNIGYVCPYVPRRHVPEINDTELNITGNRKVNRKVTIDLSIDGEIEYLNLDGTEIIIRKLNSAGEITEEPEENFVCMDTEASDWNHRELLFKEGGYYKISSVTYSNDGIDSYQAEEIITVASDQAPVAMLQLELADEANQGANYAENHEFVRNSEGISNLKVTDASVSEIGDEIVYREYKLYYDENQNGEYEETEQILVKPENEIFDESDAEDNLTKLLLNLEQVGNYKITQSIRESYTDTIEKLLREEDYLTAETSVEFKIVNQAPVSSMSVRKINSQISYSRLEMWIVNF